MENKGCTPEFPLLPLILGAGGEGEGKEARVPPPSRTIRPVAYLVEANVVGVVTEALTAHVEVVLADETGAVLADAALTATLAVLLGAGVPDGSVGHT